MDKHYHPIIAARLRSLFDTHNWSALIAYMDGLSNAHFRTAGYIIGERLLAEAEPEVFWAVACELVAWQPRAFTVTMAKAAAPRLLSGTLTVGDDGFCRLAEVVSSPERVIDREKLLVTWMPAVRQPEALEKMMAALLLTEPRRRVEFLLRVETLAAGFVLLRTLRFEEHDRELLTRTCRQLMRRGTSLAFNLASLMREFFGLTEVGGVFSLRLEAYELSRLDTDYNVFCRVVNKV